MPALPVSRRGLLTAAAGTGLIAAASQANAADLRILRGRFHDSTRAEWTYAEPVQARGLV